MSKNKFKQARPKRNTVNPYQLDLNFRLDRLIWGTVDGKLIVKVNHTIWKDNFRGMQGSIPIGFLRNVHNAIENTNREQ